MPVKKLSVALDAEVAARAARAAKVRGVSLSAWLNEAAERALKIEDGLEAVREFERERGPIGDEATAWANAQWERLFGSEDSD